MYYMRFPIRNRELHQDEIMKVIELRMQVYNHISTLFCPDIHRTNDGLKHNMQMTISQFNALFEANPTLASQI